jgi:hypothetical protein
LLKLPLYLKKKLSVYLSFVREVHMEKVVLRICIGMFNTVVALWTSGCTDTWLGTFPDAITWAFAWTNASPREHSW